MIKLKSILGEEIIHKFWWMNPNGDLFKVPLHGHAPFAIQHLTNLMKTDTNVKFDLKQSSQELGNLGWLRLSFSDDQGQSVLGFRSYTSHPTTRQIDRLKDLAQELNATVLMDYFRGTIIPFGIWQ